MEFPIDFENLTQNFTQEQKDAVVFCMNLNEDRSSKYYNKKLRELGPTPDYQEEYLVKCKHVSEKIVDRLFNELKEPPKESYCITAEEYLEIKELLDEDELIKFIDRELRTHNMFPSDFPDWLIELGKDGQPLVIQLVKLQGMFFTHEHFCKGFNQWDLVDKYGRTLAHFAAIYHSKLFGEDFAYWDLKDRTGRTVREVVDMFQELNRHMLANHGDFSVKIKAEFTDAADLKVYKVEED